MLHLLLLEWFHTQRALPDHRPARPLHLFEVVHVGSAEGRDLRAGFRCLHLLDLLHRLLPLLPSPLLPQPRRGQPPSLGVRPIAAAVLAVR